MPWGYAAATIGGALLSSDASRSASNTQADAANQATATQKAMYDQTTKNLAPFLQSGEQGSNALKNLLLNSDGTLNTNSALTKPYNQPLTMDQYQKSPYAAFLQQEGVDAAQNAASRSGLSGNVLKALSQYNQNIAGKDFQQQFQNNQQNIQNESGYQNTLYNMLHNLSGSGQNAAASQGGFGADVANQIAANQIGAGTTQAAGQIGGAASINNGINSLVNNPNINWGNIFSNPATPTINSLPSSGGGWIDSGSEFIPVA